ncbi:MAG TPA: S8 family serine peptidase [Ignavibacteria bacterium]|nr:S8 family serine peptidase [Ignavibacteria bacterium]
MKLKNLLPILFIVIVTALLISSGGKTIGENNNKTNFHYDQNYIEDELIVMLKEGVDANNFASQYNRSNSIGLEPKEVLFEPYNIWLFKFDRTKSESVNALMDVMGEPNVKLVQFNHKVQSRQQVFPNDTRFNEQWDMHNTGQTGGTPDADIDAPEAWAIATGGQTVFNDTVVCADVDDGFFLTHQDGSYWKNTREIPSNGIDDDANGYVDDYDGWSAYTNSGVITSASHGTHTSGTIGAVGNNNQGVTGVNWKVKVMAVQGSSGTEATVVKAYGYVLKQKMLYLQTNGQKGAFVVSTNSSFGVDNGQPANYPLWCGFYDSLGAWGILNCGAGPNNNVNIDIVGDIPTACPSDFMISVTNTTNTDVKNSGAGFGPINMDIGAPGTSILSTTPNNNYANNTGTSMATPHVAGTVGLMYAAAGAPFITLAKNDPDSCARLFKKFIMEGVDTLASLQSLILSKGRLNLFKTISKVKIQNVPVLNAYNLTSPAAGVTINTLPGSNTPITFNWDTSATGASYRFIFGSPNATSRQISVPAGLNSVTFTSGQLNSMLAALGVATGGQLVGQWDAWAYRTLPVNDSLKAANGPRAVTLRRQTPVLSAFNLNAPASGTTIVTSVFNTGNVLFNWRRSGEGTTYKVYYDSPTFTGPPIFGMASNNGGTDTTLTIQNSALDAILGSLGLNPGDSSVGQYAVWAYNGADSLKSTQTYNITFKRQAKGDVIVLYDSTVANCRISKDSIIAGLNSRGVTYDLFNRGGNTATTGISFRGYKKVILLGEGTSVASNRVKDSLKTYLASGGTSIATKSKLIIFAEDAGYHWGRTGSTYIDVDFVSNTLGWTFVADRPTGSTGPEGLMGDRINAGLKDSTSGPWPDVIAKSTVPSLSHLYAFTRVAGNYNGVGRMANNFNVATFCVDFESLKNAVGGASGSPQRRWILGALDYVDQINPTNIEDPNAIPTVYELKQNFPNPFNPVTKINFSIPKQGFVSMKVYDITGRLIASLVNEMKSPGYYSVDFNATNLASGVYFYRLESKEFIDVKRMMLIK